MISIDSRTFQRDIGRLSRRVEQVGANFINLELDRLHEESQLLVPYGEPDRYKPAGQPHLADTVEFVRPRPSPAVSGEIAYTAVYAWDVHENPRSGKTGGFSPQGRPYRYWAREGEFKYLEKPFLSVMQTFLSDFATYFNFNT